MQRKIGNGHNRKSVILHMNNSLGSIRDNHFNFKGAKSMNRHSIMRKIQISNKCGEEKFRIPVNQRVRSTFQIRYFFFLSLILVFGKG